MTEDKLTKKIRTSLKTRKIRQGDGWGEKNDLEETQIEQKTINSQKLQRF